jgi:hypothetical protein
MDKLKEYIDKIDAGVELTEDELSEFVGWSSENTEGDSGRWEQYIESIVEYNGRYFSICWERGLTEYQENYYNSQPIEVTKFETTETITVTKYIPVKQAVAK